MDARFERVRTNRPAATSIKRVTAICETIRIRARLRPRNPYPRDSPVRDSLSAGIKSILVDWSAGASPNSIPVNSDSPATTPSTCQFNSARKVKFSRPFASSRVRKRIPPDGERNAEHAAQRRQQNALSEEAGG